MFSVTKWLFLSLTVLIQLTIATLPIPENKVTQPFVIQADTSNAWYRLPTNTIPKSYDITLTTNIHNGVKEFDGVVKIILETSDLAENNNITLHHRKLTIGEITLSKLATPNVPISTTNDYDKVTEKLTIFTTTFLDIKTSYVLTIKYNGTLSTNEHGFYESWYKNENGQIKWLATTQFEQSDARHGFPCYDEPHLKAKFTITMIHGGKPYHALSNMPIISSTER